MQSRSLIIVRLSVLTYCLFMASCNRRPTKEPVVTEIAIAPPLAKKESKRKSSVPDDPGPPFFKPDGQNLPRDLPTRMPDFEGRIDELTGIKSSLLKDGVTMLVISNKDRARVHAANSVFVHGKRGSVSEFKTGDRIRIWTTGVWYDTNPVQIYATHMQVE